MTLLDTAADAWVKTLIAGWSVAIAVGMLAWPERQESNLRHVG